MTEQSVKISFFEDRAQVRKRLRRELKAGRTDLEWPGLTPLLDDLGLTLRSVTAGVRVLSARVVRREGDGAEDGRALEAAEHEVDGLRGRLSAARRRRAEIRNLLADWLTGLARQRPEQQALWDETYARLNASMEAELSRLSELGRALQEAERKRDQERLRAEQQQQRRRTLSARVEALVESDQAVEAEFELIYATPCALWRPELLARLRGETVELTLMGAIWQRTGESWSGVEVELSTARPAQSAELPLPREDVLSMRPRDDESRRVLRVEARSEALSRLSQRSEMPGLDDEGSRLTLAVPGRADLPSDGQPVRVEVATTRLTCAVERVAYPELSEAVFVRARLSHDGFGRNWPLLTGPVRVTREHTTMGVARLPMVSPGESFELGFGVDEGLRVRRSQNLRRETVPVLGTQKLFFTVTVIVSNMSDSARELKLVERIPVSELAEVRVFWTGSEGEPDQDGFLEIPLRLEAHARRKLEWSYRVEAGAKVRLPW